MKHLLIYSNFSSFSTLFQSYQDHERVIMKGCVQWDTFMGVKILPQGGLKLWTARSAVQHLNH